MSHSSCHSVPSYYLRVEAGQYHCETPSGHTIEATTLSACLKAMCSSSPSESVHVTLDASLLWSDCVHLPHHPEIGLLITAGFATLFQHWRHVAQIHEVSERIDAQGEVVQALDAETLLIQLLELKRVGIRHVALALMHAGQHEVHQKQVEALCERMGFVVHQGDFDASYYVRAISAIVSARYKNIQEYIGLFAPIVFMDESHVSVKSLTNDIHFHAHMEYWHNQSCSFEYSIQPDSEGGAAPITESPLVC